MWIIGLLLAGLMLAGCEEALTDQSSPLEDAAQGSQLTPVDITLLMPFNGTVGAGSSFYLVTGLPGISPVNVDLTGLNGDADLRLYTNPDFITGAAICTPASGANPETCTGTTSGAGVIYIRVVNIDLGVTSFTLNILGGPPPSASLPPPGPVTPGAFPENPDTFELDAGTNDNTVATASAIGVGVSQDRTLFPANDVDVMAVTLAAGITYEIAANNLAVRGDTFMQLLDTDGITDITPATDTNGDFIPDNDDMVGFDSNIRFTPGVGGTYYIVMTLFDPTLPTTYTLSTRIIDGTTDNDGDGYSILYDCNDFDNFAYPWSPIEGQGAASDENCDGVLIPGVGTADGFEPDDTAATANPLNLVSGEVFELQIRPETYRDFAGGGNLRTYTAATGDDYVSFTVPAFGQFYAAVSYHFVGSVQANLLDAAEVFVQADAGTGFIDMTIDNLTGTPALFYLQMWGVADGAYVPILEDLGTDVDGDGYYTQGGGLGFDCDDADGAIFPGAAGDVASDGVDTNCNGDDNS